jgi:F-type H+-transporting ATPase subunit delta
VIGSLIARRYAKALIELGTEQGNLDGIVREIGDIAETIESSAELRGLIENPQIPRTARKAVLMDVAARLNASPMTRNTIGILADGNRLRILPALALALREAADRRAGVLRAVVTSAQPLNEAYVQKLTQALESRFKK